MDKFISTFNHLLDFFIMLYARCSVISTIGRVYNLLVSLEKRVAKHVKQLYPLQRHFDNHFDLDPKSSNNF